MLETHQQLCGELGAGIVRQCQGFFSKIVLVNGHEGQSSWRLRQRLPADECCSAARVISPIRGPSDLPFAGAQETGNRAAWVAVLRARPGANSSPPDAQPGRSVVRLGEGDLEGSLFVRAIGQVVDECTGHTFSLNVAMSVCSPKASYLRALETHNDADVLAPLATREIYYRLLNSPRGRTLRHLTFGGRPAEPLARGDCNP